jgi:light-regulated signal transduction histidine kinase (bacteriophytochrome)
MAVSPEMPDDEEGNVALSETDYDAVAGVVAHGLLNTMAVISGAAELLRTEWDSLTGQRRNELLALIELQTAEASETLVHVVRGLPAEAIELLDELSRKREGPVPADPPRLRRRGETPPATA